MTAEPARRSPTLASIRPPSPGAEPAPPRSPEDLPDGLEVAGLGRTGLAIAALLLEAGVGPLALWDPAPVGPEDLGTGYLPADLGRPRAVAAERRLRDLRPRSRTYAHLGPEPLLLGSATVAVCADRLDERLIARALAAEHPVLPVVLREAAVVGPWTVAGLPGCALCRHGLGPAEAWTGEESVIGAMRTAVLVHDVLVGGAAHRVQQESVETQPWELDETSAAVVPQHGCPCDPDGLGLGLAALAAQDGEGPWSSSMTVSP